MGYRDAVPETGVEGRVPAKQAEDVLEAGRLEQMRLAQDDLPVQRLEEPVGAHDDRPVRELVLALVDPPQVLAGGVGLGLGVPDAGLPARWRVRSGTACDSRSC